MTATTYRPGTLPDAYDRRALEEELRRIFQALEGARNALTLRVTHVDPTVSGKVQGGEIWAADGTDWMPVPGLNVDQLVYRIEGNTAWRYILSVALTNAAAARTFLNTPTSANLAALVSDETGSGPLVFGTAPTLTNPQLVNPTTTGTEFIQQTAPVSFAVASTLAASDLLNGIIRYTGAAANLTTPTGAQIDTAVSASLGSSLAANRAFDFSIQNAGSGTATLTAAASGITLTGTMTVTAGASGIFRARKTAADTYTIYRIA